ncbi:type II toxin-antitoxin system Phd/YefM family antitoxin [Thiotrichales bacterium 19S11-10]|nr:type II toxin-antitoxin system Phd/YefM family antitoxin [Thiotrichales bacterium 19S11-10]MCF6806952.1 type II toxin-antitoxin system Phd/YefM family antitoxin [Thiotrichales bacterium 19S9-11]MCF6810921.1 type II toxin-antitoxin system Phd/YefM family antitoxin [Thiotrichales bacterium 19S9-12]
MHHIYGIGDAKQNFPKLIQQVSNTGEEILITKDKQLVAKIIPIVKKARIIGKLKNKPYFIADDFDAPSDEINQLFLGE